MCEFTPELLADLTDSFKFVGFSYSILGFFVGLFAYRLVSDWLGFVFWPVLRRVRVYAAKRSRLRFKMGG